MRYLRHRYIGPFFARDDDSGGTSYDEVRHEYDYYLGQKVYKYSFLSNNHTPATCRGGIGAGNCVDRKNWYINISSYSGKRVFDNLDLNMAFYSYESGKDSGGSNVDRSNILPAVYTDDDYATYSNRVAAARSAGMASDYDANPQFMLENYQTRIDRYLEAWDTERTETETSGSGDSETTKTILIITHHTKVSSKGAPFPDSEINSLQGATFRNCIIGGPFDDFLSCDVGSDHNVVELIKLNYLNLTRARFENCRIKGSDMFAHSDLNGATFVNCLIEDVDFSLCGNPFAYSQSYSDVCAAYQAQYDYESEGLSGEDLKYFDEFWYENHPRPTPSVSSSRIDTYRRDTTKNPRPYLDWSGVEYEDIDIYDQAYRGDVSYIDFTGSYLKNCKFNSNGEAAGWNLTRCKFHNCNISNSCIHQPVIDNTKFTDTPFNNTKLVNFKASGPDRDDKGLVIFSNVTFSNRSALVGLKINNYDFSSKLSNTYISRCILNNCNLSSIDFSDKSLALCNLNSCNLNSATLSRALLDGSVISGGSMTGFRFAFLGFPSLQYCTLDNVSVSTSNSDAMYSVMPGVIMTNITLSNINFFFSNLNSAKLNSVTFNNCNFNGATANFSSMTNVTFNNCSLRGMKFLNASVSNVKFNNCNARGARFKNCSGANMNMFNSSCDTSGIDL